MEDMGHVSVRMIRNHYADMATPEDAERYWSIAPSAPAANVVLMAKAS